jgi:hypothetical protein
MPVKFSSRHKERGYHMSIIEDNLEVGFTRRHAEKFTYKFTSV